MNAAIIELNTLTNTVWTTAKNHNLWLIAIYWVLIWCIIGRVVVCVVLCTAYMNTFPSFFNTKLDAAVANIIFRYSKKLA